MIALLSFREIGYAFISQKSITNFFLQHQEWPLVKPFHNKVYRFNIPYPNVTDQHLIFTGQLMHSETIGIYTSPGFYFFSFVTKDFVVEFHNGIKHVSTCGVNSANSAHIFF